MTQIDRFAYAFQHGRVGMAVRGCYGRIVRTRHDRPLALAEEQDRRVVMVMGPAALRSLIGKSGYEMLLSIGYKRDYIERKTGEGFAFALLVFARPKGWLKVANWRNTIDGVIAAYPEVAEIVRANADALRSTGFAEFEKQAGFSFAEVDVNGVTDERFITVDRLLQSDRSALVARRFLYHTVRLSELYTGSGMTMTDDGQRGLREYVMPICTVSQLNELHELRLAVALPPRESFVPEMLKGAGGDS